MQSVVRFRWVVVARRSPSSAPGAPFAALPRVRMAFAAVSRRRKAQTLKIAISSCLLGEPCRYDGRSCPSEAARLLQGLDGVELVPVCPEVLGGLPVPRPPSEVDAAERVLRVTSAEGTDVTAAFMVGAQAALKAVGEGGCKLAVLKAKSPSCGCGLVYDGTFSGVLVPGYGATARLLRTEGVRVIDEEQLAAVLAASAVRRPGALPALFAETSAACPVLQTERLVLLSLIHI